VERQHRLGLGAQHAVPLLQAEPIRRRHRHAGHRALARRFENGAGLARPSARALWWTCCPRWSRSPAPTLPDAWPDRELRRWPASRSRRSSPAGSIQPRPPIHLLFSNDRGLRDGDWKLVSFRGQPWELYNLAEDRTELHDLAAQYAS
jgi:hypothetical protein